MGLERVRLREQGVSQFRASRFQTDGAIAPEQLRRWAGIKLNQNLLALDIAKVKRDLEMIPRIQSASVDRLLPGTLMIQVVEREPLAQSECPTPTRAGRRH
jgi:cell division septal protein FtsQ